MKEILSLVILIILLTNYNKAQINIDCGNIPVEKNAIAAQTGGKYKPSSNAPGQYLRILFVFAQFSGDTRNFED